jgi:hypothetical protein
MIDVLYNITQKYAAVCDKLSTSQGCCKAGAYEFIISKRTIDCSIRR